MNNSLKIFCKYHQTTVFPAIVDHSPQGAKEPVSIFESGAILLYLAEKTGSFLSQGLNARYDVLQWLFWQVGGLGPMAGQNHHFSQHANDLTYAVDRYVRETTRLYGVLNKHLANREFIAGEYSIADMACDPWIVLYEKQQQNLDDFPFLKWFLKIQERPAVRHAYDAAKEINVNQVLSEEAKQILFNQGQKAQIQMSRHLECE